MEGRIHLFADTRYRLFVNDTFVAYGPARFVTGHPEFDTFDLGKWLRAGENQLRVEVNFYGCSSFQTMPDGMPGFIAAGGTNDRSVSFATPGAWRVTIHRAWEADAPHFSFAQNPAEICDTRVLAAELSEPASLLPAVLPAAARPWGPLSERSAPYPDYLPVRPARLLVAGPLLDSRRWGCQLKRPKPASPEAPPTPVFVAFATWVYSPRAQQTELECFWGVHHLNGQLLETKPSRSRGNHCTASVRLKEGWNFLAGNFSLLSDHWAFLLGFPADSGVSLHSRPTREEPRVFLFSPPLTTRELLPPPARPKDFAPPEGWTETSSDLTQVTPARIVAWDSPDSARALCDLPAARLSELSPIQAHAAVWSFDFGDEYHGHPVIEVEAPAGSVLDIAYDDWHRGDGCVDLFHSNPFTDAADRFVLRGGRQRVMVCNPRGGIFLQVILRAPDGIEDAPLSLIDLSLRRRTTLGAVQGDFACGDPVLDWAWRISTHTLVASTDEAYCDCPWRERGSYIGDSQVNLHLHRLVSADLAVARRTLDLFGKAQLPNGQLACCAPSWLRKPHEDFTLIWVQAVRDYWSATGDLAFARAQMPVLRGIFSSPTWKADADGLWDSTGMRLFIDWGVLVAEREGVANGVLNILRVAALRAGSELALALGEREEAERWEREAAAVSGAVAHRLWHEGEGRLLASEGATTPALHANVLALRHGVGPAAQILAYLEPHLRNNFENGTTRGEFSGHIELYFMHTLFEALVRQDRPDLVEHMIRETYGFLKRLGHPTLPECFNRAHDNGGSCCHSWSGAPAIYATSWVLGLRQASPGVPDAWLLDPLPGDRHSAEGAVPHPRGPIRARWVRSPEGIVAYVSAPPGVTVSPGPGVLLVHNPAALHLPRGSAISTQT